MKKLAASFSFSLQWLARRDMKLPPAIERFDLMLAVSPTTRATKLAASLSRCSRSRFHQGAAGISGGVEGLYPRASVHAKLGE